MKDEIKEILEDNGELIVRYKDNSFECFDTLPKNVLDYITNLQEKYNNSQITLAGEWKKRLEVEEKNKHLDNQIAMLKQQNNAITEMGLDYKSRCEKAIKCIKDKYYKEEYERKGTFTNKLMNILQGKDKQ